MAIKVILRQVKQVAVLCVLFRKKKNKTKQRAIPLIIFRHNNI